MSAIDIFLMTSIAGGAVWLLYRSLWKNKGHCHDCAGGGCSRK